VSLPGDGGNLPCIVLISQTAETSPQRLRWQTANMARVPSADELEQLAKLWFSEAHRLSAQDEAEIEAWKKEYRKWTYFTGSDDGSCSGGDAGIAAGIELIPATLSFVVGR
jgi:hypothetical protein